MEHVRLRIVSHQLKGGFYMGFIPSYGVKQIHQCDR